MIDYADLEKRLRESADALEEDPSFGLPGDVRAMREAADALASLRQSVIAFCGPHAVRYANDFGLAPRELHPQHYDLLAACGARMDDFLRAPDLSRALPSQDETT